MYGDEHAAGSCKTRLVARDKATYGCQFSLDRAAFCVGNNFHSNISSFIRASEH